MQTQVGAGIPAVLLAVLSAYDVLTVSVIMVAAGTLEAFDKPLRHTFAADVVPPTDSKPPSASSMLSNGKRRKNLSSDRPQRSLRTAIT